MNLVKANRDLLFKAALLIIFTSSFFLRFFYLEKFPLQMNVDEISNLYDGYSIAETGGDRWGMKTPVILRGFGDFDYRPPLYAWMVAGTIKLFGYSDFAARFPSAVFGFLSLVFVYLVSLKVAGRLFALLTLLLVSLSPWQLLFSRIGVESAVLPGFLLILAIFLWLKAKENKYSYHHIVYAGFVTGFGVNAYQASKLVFFLLTILLAWDIFRNADQKIKKIFLFGFVALIGALPQVMAALLYPEHFVSRAHGTMMSFSLSAGYFFSLVENGWRNISPNFLFFMNGIYNNLTVSRLLPVEVLFFYTGLFSLLVIFRKDILRPAYFYYLLFISIIPAALTVDNPHALRASCLIVLLPLVTASGILFIYQKIKKEMLQTLFLLSVVILIVGNAGFFIYKYTRSYDLRNAGHQNELVQLCQKLDVHKNKYSSIYMEDTFNQPYIYILNYCHISPVEFIKYKKVFNPLDNEYMLQMDKYYFMSRADIYEKVKSDKSNFIFIVKEKNSFFHLLDSVPDKESIYIYSSY